MPLTSGQLKYLLALHRLAPNGEAIPSARVAESLGVTRASTTKMLLLLTAENLVLKERYGKAALTPAGIRLAEERGRGYEAAVTLFTQSFSVPMEKAREMALQLLASQEYPHSAERDLRKGKKAGILKKFGLPIR